jgi:hypothetical protein
LFGLRINTADLTGARLDGADLTDARWPEGVEVPDGWIVDSGSHRLKPAAQLLEIMPHYL